MIFLILIMNITARSSYYNMPQYIPMPSLEVCERMAVSIATDIQRERTYNVKSGETFKWVAIPPHRDDATGRMIGNKSIRVVTPTLVPETRANETLLTYECKEFPPSIQKEEMND